MLPDLGRGARPARRATRTARPAHVVRFGAQTDMQGIIAPSADADRAVRYLTKYLTKAIADAHADDDGDRSRRICGTSTGCTPSCAACPARPAARTGSATASNPTDAGPGLVAGQLREPAHDRANLGCGGRRVLVSRQWSGKTLAEHRADRATVVREALAAAGIVAPEIERMAADRAPCRTGRPGSCGPTPGPTRPPTPG